MNPIAEEIRIYEGSASMTDEEYLEHYGIPRRSGRYPYGSGDDPYQHGRDFLRSILCGSHSEFLLYILRSFGPAVFL